MISTRNAVLLTEMVDTAKDKSLRKELSVSKMLLPILAASLNCNPLSQAKEEDLRLTERNMQASKKKQSAFEVQMNQLREQKVREEPIMCQTL